MTRQERRFKGLQWTTVIANGLRTIHPYCSFGFKWHVLKNKGSQRMGPEFKCYGYCRFEDCPATVTVTVNSERDLKARVFFSGTWCIHNRIELKQRPVRANERTKYSKELQKRLPRSAYLDRLSAITEEVFESGCRDDVPSPQVLKNITREVKLKSRLHSHRDAELSINV